MIKSIQVNRYHVCKKLPMVLTIIEKKSILLKQVVFYLLQNSFQQTAFIKHFT